MEFCWICGDIADSEEHKFKASDIKKYYGKKTKAYYISDNDVAKLSSYKDKKLKFTKVICINCNNKLTRPHDDAYDIFINYCLNNFKEILKLGAINFEIIYGENWKIEKLNLYRYYAKHAGCKIVTSNLDLNLDLKNLSEFIKGNKPPCDFILKFEQKKGVEILINGMNQFLKYNHLYNSATFFWNKDISVKLGGWLTNNYITSNWIFGKKINLKAKNILEEKIEPIIFSEVNYFESIYKQIPTNSDDPLKLKFIDQYINGFENALEKSSKEMIMFYEKLISINNSLR